MKNKTKNKRIKKSKKNITKKIKYMESVGGTTLKKSTKNSKVSSPKSSVLAKKSKPSSSSSNKITEPEPEVQSEVASIPVASMPEASMPVVTMPEASMPVVTMPEVSQPEVSEPEVSEPASMPPMPVATMPEASQPEVLEPEVQVNPAAAPQEQVSAEDAIALNEDAAAAVQEQEQLVGATPPLNPTILPEDNINAPSVTDLQTETLSAPAIVADTNEITADNIDTLSDDAAAVADDAALQQEQVSTEKTIVEENADADAAAAAAAAALQQEQVSTENTLLVQENADTADAAALAEKAKKVKSLISETTDVMKRLNELEARINETSASSSDIPSAVEVQVNETESTTRGGKNKLKRKKTLYKKYNSNTSLKRKHKTNKNK